MHKDLGKYHESFNSKMQMIATKNVMIMKNFAHHTIFVITHVTLLIMFNSYIGVIFMFQFHQFIEIINLFILFFL